MWLVLAKKIRELCTQNEYLQTIYCSYLCKQGHLYQGSFICIKKLPLHYYYILFLSKFFQYNLWNSNLPHYNEKFTNNSDDCFLIELLCRMMWPVSIKINNKWLKWGFIIGHFILYVYICTFILIFSLCPVQFFLIIQLKQSQNTVIYHIKQTSYFRLYDAMIRYSSNRVERFLM